MVLNYVYVPQSIVMQYSLFQEMTFVLRVEKG